MSDERTHGAESAIDDEDPVAGLLTPSEIRFHALRGGDKARQEIAALPQSESRDRLLALQERIQKFWAEEASDDFCRQWLLIAIGMSR